MNALNNALVYCAVVAKPGLMHFGNEMFVYRQGDCFSDSKSMEGIGFNKLVDFLDQNKLIDYYHYFVCDKDLTISKSVREDLRLMKIKVLHDPGHIRKGMTSRLKTVLGSGQYYKQFPRKISGWLLKCTILSQIAGIKELWQLLALKACPVHRTGPLPSSTLIDTSLLFLLLYHFEHCRKWSLKGESIDQCLERYFQQSLQHWRAQHDVQDDSVSIQESEFVVDLLQELKTCDCKWCVPSGWTPAIWKLVDLQPVEENVKFTADIPCPETVAQLMQKLVVSKPLFEAIRVLIQIHFQLRAQYTVPHYTKPFCSFDCPYTSVLFDSIEMDQYEETETGLVLVEEEPIADDQEELKERPEPVLELREDRELFQLVTGYASPTQGVNKTNSKHRKSQKQKPAVKTGQYPLKPELVSFHGTTVDRLPQEILNGIFLSIAQSNKVAVLGIRDRPASAEEARQLFLPIQRLGSVCKLFRFFLFFFDFQGFYLVSPPRYYILACPYSRAFVVRLFRVPSSFGPPLDGRVGRHARPTRESTQTLFGVKTSISTLRPSGRIEPAAYGLQPPAQTGLPWALCPSVSCFTRFVEGRSSTPIFIERKLLVDILLPFSPTIWRSWLDSSMLLEDFMYSADEFCHGMSTSRVEGLWSERARLVPKSSAFKKYWSNRQAFNNIFHNQNYSKERTYSLIYKQLGLPMKDLMASRLRADDKDKAKRRARKLLKSTRLRSKLFKQKTAEIFTRLASIAQTKRGPTYRSYASQNTESESASSSSSSFSSSSSSTPAAKKRKATPVALEEIEWIDDISQLTVADLKNQLKKYISEFNLEDVKISAFPNKASLVTILKKLIAERSGLDKKPTVEQLQTFTPRKKMKTR